MLKSEITYLSKQMNLNIRDHPYLELHGRRGSWKFLDHRTYEDDEDIPHVYPVGVNHHSIYVINPFTGEITSHGFDGTDYYTGHKSQGYIVERVQEYPVKYTGILQIMKQMNGYRNLKKKYERKCN